MDGEDHNRHDDGVTTIAANAGGGGGGTSIQITALDGIVNVNSLFTLAVFIGLSYNPSDPTLTPSPDCSPSHHVAESMIAFHVYSFASFLLSSLVALCLKQTIRIHPCASHSGTRAARVNRAVLRAGIMASAVGSTFGCGFLMLVLIDLVQIKLGKFGCGGATVGAVIPLVTLIPVAMISYIGVVFYAFTR